MSCKYILKGREFASELELDDFLLERYPMLAKLGDVVFSLSITNDLLFSLNLLSENDKEVKKSEAAMAKARRIWSEDGESFEIDPPYIGVNAFLSGRVGVNDTLLYPEFRPDNYWYGEANEDGVRDGGRFKAWSIGDYTKDELDLFFGDEQPFPIKDKTQAEEYKKKMENKWENQCLFGDAVHAIFELYFTKQEDKYRKDYISDPTEMNKFKEDLSKLKFKRKDGSYKLFTELINDRIFNSVIGKCRELAEYFDKRYPGAMFFPEYSMVTDISVNEGPSKLKGIIDLLVIDANGCPHVIDYKTSPHPFEDLGDIKGFSSAKKLAYTYLLGTYGRMLGKLGFNIDDTDYLVVPMLLADFLNINHEYDHFSFSGINFKGTESGIFHNITNDIKTKENIVTELNDFADVPVHYEINTDGIISNTVNGMKTWLLKYNQFKQYDRDAIVDELKESGCLDEKNKETNKYEWKPKGSQSNFTISADTETELVDKVLKYRNNLPKYRRSLTTAVVKALKEGIEAGTADGVEFPTQVNYGEVGVSPEWFKTKMSRYCNQNWTVCEGDKYEALKEYGLIALFNTSTHQFNFVKISTLNLKYINNLSSTGEKTTNLAGGLGKSDLYWQSKNNSLMLQAANGNIELIETMLLINNMSQVFGNNAIVGDIEVMDPNHGFGLSATNEELMYCFNQMYAIKPLDVSNNFLNGNIKMGSRIHTAYTTFHDIMSMGAREDINWSGKYAKFKDFQSALSLLDNAIVLPKESQIKALEELTKKLKTAEGNLLLDKITTEQGTLSLEHVALYNQALLALAELKGVNFRLLLREHSKWCESLAVWKNGLSGLYLDNPGNLLSETLNLITKLVTEAYQNVRQDMLEPTAKMRELVEALKKKKNVGWMEEHTILNQADLYKNLYRDDIKDDIVFKNPWKSNNGLSKEESDLLKYVLTEINRNRFGLLAEEKRVANAIEYFRVPLVKGDSSAFATKKGMLESLKDRLSLWVPQKALETAKAKAEGIYNYLSSEQEQKTRSTENIFEMNNLFDKGENAANRRAIMESGKFGPEYWESNIETLLLKHEFAYSMKDRINNVMPMIKAAMVHLTTSGFTLNYEFNEDINYAKDYIRNKIKNESIVPPQYEKAAAFAEKLKGAASKMVLALSPVQAIYLPLQGIWNDISLVLRKPDGSNAFTKLNMWDSFKSVWAELFTSSDRPTITSLLNELYGINDMDINTYADKLKSDLHGIFNITNFLFKFASRPDYYNRMTMFLAKMRGDGCFEAHSVVNGRLVYNSKLDKRYAAYLNNPKGNSPEILKAKALYYAAAKLFEAEGAEVYINGKKEKFKLNMQDPMPLPRAYTNQEAESTKNLSDTIYGYYSHEKKSLVHSMLIGSLWMHFKTFWSGKKNLYLLSGGVKLEGNWVPYVENGLLYFYQVDETGNVREDLPPVTTDTGFPVYRWEGNWKEGIFLTLIKLSGGMVHDGIGEGINEIWNCEDPKLRQAYRSNIIQFIYDLTIWGLIGGLAAGALGDWVKDEKKDMDETDVLDGIRLSAMQVLVNSVKNSALDFNFIDSIGSPGFSWTPFAFEFYSRLLKNFYGVLTGDTRLYDAMIKSTSLGRMTRPIWNAINPEEEK